MATRKGINISGNYRRTPYIKAVVNTVGGLLASRRVFCWLPVFLFVPVRQIQTKAPPYKHANKKQIARIAAVYQKLVRQLCSDFSEHIVK